MDTLQETLTCDSKPVSPGRPIALFWGATVVLAAASAAGFLALALRDGVLGGTTKAFCVVAMTYSAVVLFFLRNATWRRRLEHVTSKLLFLAISTAFSLSVLELAVRMLSPASPIHPALAMRHWQSMKMEIDLPGVSPTGMYSTNRWGLRGDEPPADWANHYTILTIGGSTTQCYYLDDRKTWPYLLQEKLQSRHPQVWVGNAGIAGHSTRSHLVFVREAIPKVRPDAVILLVGINDLSLSLNENARLRGNGMDVDSNLRKSNAVDPVRRLLIEARRRSRLFQLALVWKQVLFREVAVINSTGGDVLTSSPLDKPPPPLPADLRSALPQLDEFRENVRQIIEIGRENNVRVIFLTQPFRFGDTEEDRKRTPNYYWLNQGDAPSSVLGWSGAQHWLLLEEYNRNLRAVCDAEGVECFDLAKAVPHDDGSFYDLAHFNDAGAETVASAVASFIENSAAPPEK